jgi:hypothetical protein
MADEEKLQKELERKNGVLRLEPNFPMQAYPGMNRIGVRNSRLGKLGYASERWIACCVGRLRRLPSEPKTQNAGLSVISLETSHHNMLLSDAFDLSPDRMLGENFAKANHNTLGFMLGILDVGYPIFSHIHPSTRDESYYFLQHPKAAGHLPYSHLGLHPGTNPSDVLGCLKRWNDDKILDLSPAYRLNIGEGFYTRAGVPHAPGTALTLELGEAADEYHILQAEYMGKIFSKQDFLLKELQNEDDVIKLINFEASTDPQYYQKYHLQPEPVSKKPEGECSERWIYTPRTTTKYSGKELTVKPGAKITCHEVAAHPILIWQGRGIVGHTQVCAKLGQDEVFVTKETAEAGYTIKNTGSSWLVAYKAFGPNVYSQI